MALGDIKLRSTGSAVTTLATNVSANITGTITLKNAPLTHSEVDLNFLEIAEDVAALQNATTTFTDLTDTPANFSGAGGKYLRINSGATAVEFDTLTTDDVTEGANLYYTDARARASISASGSLSYNSSTGAMSYTQGDTDTVAEGSTNLYYTDARADTRATLRITAADIGNLNNVDETGVANGKILKYNGSTSKWEIADDVDTDTGILNVVEDTSPQLGGTLDANAFNIDMGTNIITDAKVGEWDTSYGWGNHASAGYLTAISGQSIGALSDVTITSPTNTQILRYSGGAWINTDVTLNREDDFDIKTADFTADESRRYGIDTSSGSVTVTLPAAPTTNRAVLFAQAGGDFSVNNFIINPNGKNINGSSGNYTHSTNLDFASIGVFYNGTEWRKYS